MSARKTATLRQVRARVKALGADLEVGRRKPLDCQALAPFGKVFVADRLHILVAVHNPDVTEAEALGDLMERMADGVAPCEDEGCDCKLEDDES